MNGVIKLGGKEVEISEIFSTPEPTAEEMATFCNTLKLLIASRVLILSAFKLTAKTTSHPWLIAVLYFADKKIREGEDLTDSIASGLKELIQIRIEEVASCRDLPDDWREIAPLQWAVPDFFGFFSLFLSMVEVGEESGELHTSLDHVRQIYLGEGGFGEQTWGRDIAILNRAMGMLFVAGLPHRAIARVLCGLPALRSLRSELEIFARAIDDDATVSEAFAETNGRLADPIYVGLIEVGEKAGAVWAVFDGMGKN